MLAKELIAILMKEPEAVVLMRIDDGDYGWHEKELSEEDIEIAMQVKGNGFYSAFISGEKVPTITIS